MPKLLLKPRLGGGRVHHVDSVAMLRDGGLVISGGSGVFDDINRLALAAFNRAAAPGLPPKS